MVRAAVMVGATETTYRRTGVGPTVVVLTHQLETDASTLAPLAERCRVVVPEAVTVMALLHDDCAESPFAAWLLGFLEGLGVATVRIVASRSFARPLEELRGAHPGLIKDLLVLDDVPVSWERVAAEMLDRRAP